MDKVYVVTQGVNELYYVRTEGDLDDYDAEVYTETTVCSEKVIGVFNDISAAIRYMVEKSKERIEWMQKNGQPYLTKEVYSWTVAENRPEYYAVLLADTEFIQGEYLKYESHDVK